MARAWDGKKFDAVYSEFVCTHFGFSAPPDYCSRYRSRYKTLIRRFCDLAWPLTWLPGHIVLEKLRRALKPDGILIAQPQTSISSHRDFPCA
jgi:hypothetical protein